MVIRFWRRGHPAWHMTHPPHPEQPNSVSITLKAIAERCGVSHTTVMRALSGHGYVAAHTRQRIEQTAREMGYNPAVHQAARRMGLRRFGKQVINHVLALFLPHNYYSSNFFSSLLNGMQTSANAAGFATIVTVFHPADESDSQSLPPIFSSGEIDAIIGFFQWPKFASFLTTVTPANQHPMPIIGLINPHPSYTSVRSDEEHGAYLAVQHLLALGHRRLLFSDLTYSSSRIHGAERAVREAGLDPREVLIKRHWHLGNFAPPYHTAIYQPGGPDDPINQLFSHYYQNFLEFLRTHRDITAILATNDVEARRIGYFLTNSGYQIPGDISLVGFDDTDAWLDRYGHNILTTVHQPLIAIGERAATYAIEQLTNPTDGVADIILPPTLTIRASTSAVSPPSG